MNSMRMGKLIQKTIQHIHCSNESDFKQIWGEHMGAHLWGKYRGTFGGRVDDLLCSLDNGNLELLVLAVEEKMVRDAIASATSGGGK